jgi:hypothetical protein
MLITPYRVSGDHPLLTLFATFLLPWVFPASHVGWDTTLFAEKYPHVYLVPLNVGYITHVLALCKHEPAPGKALCTLRCYKGARPTS